MIKIYGICLDQLPSAAGIADMLEPSLYRAWQKGHPRMRNEASLRESLAGTLLLQLGGLSGDLIYDENGRPRFDQQAVDFSITHTDEWAFCAIEDSADAPRVGLDAETISRDVEKQIKRLARRWFSRGETELFLADPSKASFLQIWTRKEALIKWQGGGLRAIQKADTLTAPSTYGVHFCDYRVQDVQLALCFRAAAEPPKELRIWSKEEIFKGAFQQDT